MRIFRLRSLSILITIFLANNAHSAGTEGTEGTLLGQGAGAGLTSGFLNNTFIGVNAGFSSATSNDNTFVGDSSGSANTTGFSNTFIGSASGFFNTTGERNTFVGQQAGISNTTGSSNTFVGENAGFGQTTANNNTFMGQDSGRETTTGSGNTYLGRFSGRNSTSGELNTYVGNGAGRRNTIGSENTFIGQDSGSRNTTGTFNTFVGRHAGLVSQDGITNTYIGHSAGSSNVTGDGNVFLGYAAGSSETGSFKLYIENSGNADPLIYGDFVGNIVGINGTLGVGTELPTASLHVRRADGTAKVLVEETNNTPAPRTLFELANKGNTKFVINNTDAGVEWAFTNSGFDFRISRQGSGAVEMTIDNSGNLEVVGTSTASNHINSSSRTLKHGFEDVDQHKMLELVTILPISSWKYNKADTGGRHIGPVAEDFQEIFGLGDGKHISTIDSAGIALAAIQGLNQKLEAKDKTIQKLKVDNDLTKSQLSDLQAKLNKTQVLVEKIMAMKSLAITH